jgi:hypothetical protein
MEDLQEEMNEKLSALMEEVKLLTNSLRTVKKENEEMWTDQHIRYIAAMLLPN